MVEARQGGSELDFAAAEQNLIYPPATKGGTDKYAAPCQLLPLFVSLRERSKRNVRCALL